ncbi:MAG: stalk domain-containing protein [Oscillospiraceae bacterium]|nr:stalk domain-containing protein [Oscillospiraceae bacterium]
MCKKNIIKIISTAAAILILLPLFNFVSFAFDADDLDAYNTFTIYSNDCDVAPFVQNGHIMLPFRDFFETFGAKIEWDDESKTATAIYKSNACNLEIDVFMGKKPLAGQFWNRLLSDMNITVNGAYFPVFFTVPATIVNNRLFIPADFIETTLGAKISIDKNSDITAVLSDDNFIEAARCESEKTEVIRLVNEVRVANGLKELKRNIVLDEVCRLKAIDKATYKYAGHTSEKYGTPSEMLEKFTTKLKWSGECLAAGQKTSAAVVEAWLNSPGHNAIIVADYPQFIGVGTVTGENGVIYWSLMTART